jgi:hypothetical protein
MRFDAFFAAQSSLRANGSRECAPDARLREAIQQRARLDCLVASLLAMTEIVPRVTVNRPTTPTRLSIQNHAMDCRIAVTNR